MLEWSLTYLTGLIENWDDTKHREVLGHPGEPLRNTVPLSPSWRRSALARTLASSPSTPDGS
jgi:hypothetical protein